MAKRQLSPITPKTIIKNAIRRLWMYSREKRAAIKERQNTCKDCNKIGSVAKGKKCKIEVHHKNTIDWERIINVIREEILVDTELLEVLCKECHEEKTAEQRKEGWKKK